MKIDKREKQLINSIYSPPRQKNGRHLKDIYDGDYQIREFSLARHALLAGLKVLGLKKGDSVLLPSFICGDVLAPFNLLGLKILFYPVDEKLKITTRMNDLPNASAIMAVHYFGLETDLSIFREYCQKHKALLIEDNAHGMFSRSADGQLLGTLGDIGIISIRKTLPISNGALLIYRNKAENIPILTSIGAPSVRMAIKNVFRSMITLCGTGFLIGVTKLKRRLRLMLKGDEFPPSQSEDEYNIPLSPNPINIEEYMETVDVSKEVNRRRELFNFLSKLAKNLQIQPLKEFLSPSEVPYVYPFWCSPENISLVKKELESIGLEFVNWPTLPQYVQEDKEKPHFYSNLYMVKFLW